MPVVSSCSVAADGEEDRADEEDDPVDGRAHELDEARKRPDEEAGRADREEDADPPASPGAVSTRSGARSDRTRSSDQGDDGGPVGRRSSLLVSETASGAKGAPQRAGLVLCALILVAAVANLNLSVANVALPSIGEHFDSGQTTLDMIAVGYSLGLACSVLWLGALGDRFGRKMMLLLGTVLAIPMSVLAALAPSDIVLALARIGGGFAAGMAYPTTLALITALWSPGAGRTKSIALWSGLGGAIAALGPLLAGLLLEHFYWGSPFWLTLPLAVVAIYMACKYVPAHVNEGTERVDNLGGLLSLVLVGALILAINFAPVPNATTLTVILSIVAVVGLGLFYLRERRAKNPLYDLAVAARPTFWVAACAGIIVFGSLMGAMFIGQQFLQNVLGYSTLDAGLAILPAAFCMVLVAPRSAKIVEARGARFTLLLGYVFVLAGFLTMILLWKENIGYWKVGLGYAFVGIGVGFAGTPASHSLTGSVPVTRVGMASGTADLQRDLGGAVMQSIFGALLTAGYATAFAATISQSGQHVSDNVQNELTKSFDGAQAVAAQYPQYAGQIEAAAKAAFLQGDQLGVPGGDHRRARRGCARRLLLPQEGEGGAAAGRATRPRTPAEPSPSRLPRCRRRRPPEQRLLQTPQRCGIPAVGEVPETTSAAGHIVGRDAELATLEEFLEPGGTPRGFVLTGGPGVGKTALWEAGIEAARRRGLRVLRASGSGAETQLSFAALIDLLDGIDLERLDAPPGAAASGARGGALPGRARPAPRRSPALALGLLSTLRSLAAREPVLVAIDDVQWLDETSADALAFAARRLEAEPVAFLLARRPGPAVRARARARRRDATSTEVGRLSIGAMRRMLSERLGL